MQKRVTSQFLINALLLLVLLVHVTIANGSRNRTPARLLAKQTGATQFEEERYETHTDCTDHKHHLKKRSSDEDIDYEVYQGVVGRPGIDFPIYPRIPKTSFSCRSFGNGYFADMETDCQVFHICEDGRKISFLCPNGTIFQQSELTCDWWFKVNCLGSQGYYAESAEILNKQRIQRVRPAVPVQGFNIVGGATSTGLDIKPKHASSAPRTHQYNQNNKSDRRIDSNEEPSLESVDFEDISSEKLKGQPHKIISNIDNNSNDNESQTTAETASFVGNKRRNNYNYEKTETGNERKTTSAPKNNNKNSSSRRTHNERGSQRVRANSNTQNNRHEPSERTRSGQRGQQRFREEKKPLAESYESEEVKEQRKKQQEQHVLPEKIIQPIVAADISPKFNNQLDITAEAEVKPEFYQAPSARTTQKTQATTAAYNVGTYSTARRLDSTRTTPFYTPTIPTVVKSKSTEGKSFYIKANVAATTPNPNRFNVGSGSSLVLESSAVPKSTTAKKTSSTQAAITADSTLRPFVIGMRQHSRNTTSEIHRIPITANSHFNVDLVPPHKTNFHRDSIETLSSTTTSPSTGPTYLPKSASVPNTNNGGGGDDSLLFAPSPSNDETVTRNVNEMLKTMNLLKDTIGAHKLRDVEEINFQGQVRTGLEIPPSSGPDALVSLAKYFASEHNESKANLLNTIENTEKPTRKSASVSAASNAASASTTALKPADSAAVGSTATTPAVSIKADDIKGSLLSEKTVNKYSSLFGLKEARGKQQSSDPSEGLLSFKNITTDVKKDATTTVTSGNFPYIGSTDATIKNLAEKPESRKIAQVFSNALTTYLEDPKTFRAQLASARPTEPPIRAKTEDDLTITDSTLFNSGTAASYLPTKPTPTIGITATTTKTLASEINNKFDSSTQVTDFGSTTEAFDSTTYRASGESQEQKQRLELSAELFPPSPDSGEGDEFFQREQTQSFVKSRNNLQHDKNKKGSSQKKPNKSNLNAAYITNTKPTESPWNHMSQNDFLDPLTINDGLMKEQRTTTFSPFTYLPKEITTSALPTARVNIGRQEVLSAHTQRGLQHSSQEVAPRNGQYRHTLETESWHDIFNNYDLPRETLPSSSGLQRIANKLFGGLNETEALHLKNVMQQAEHNRQVLSLLLLLIQTCDDQNGKALERSRKHLLNALIDMDGKVQQGKVSHHKAESKSGTSSSTTTSRVPVTTYRRGSEDTYTSTISYPSTTTDLPTTTISSSTLTPGSGSIEETTKFEIRVEDLDEDFTNLYTTSSPYEGGVSNNSDKRALELLKSLYSLASKFTSRR